MTIEIERKTVWGLWCAVIQLPNGTRQGCWGDTIPLAQVRALKWLDQNGYSPYIMLAMIDWRMR